MATPTVTTQHRPLDTDTLGRTTAITVISAIKPWWALFLRFNFWRVGLMRRLTGPSGIDRALKKLSFIHFAHWAVFSAGKQRYLLFHSNFNGGAQEYIEAFSMSVRKGMRALWGGAYDVPPPTPVGPFIEYIRREKLPTTYYYAAYPEASTTMVCDALELRRKFESFRTEVPRLGPDRFAAAYARFVTDANRRGPADPGRGTTPPGKGLCVLTPFSHEAEAPLREALAELADGDESPFAATGCTHFARFVVVPQLKDRRGYQLDGTSYLLFAAEFDGARAEYVERLSGVSELRALWRHCDGFEAGNLPRYLLEHRIEPGYSVIGYPGATVGDVRAAVALEKRLKEFFAAAQGLQATELRHAWLRRSRLGMDSAAAETQVDQADLQGNILCGYGNDFRHGYYAFIKIADGLAARRLLAKLSPWLTNAVPWDFAGETPKATLNVALTFEGLAAVGLSDRALGSFPAEFREGMEARAELLGDTGTNGPENWDGGLRADDTHLMISVFATEAQLLAQRRRWLQVLIADSAGGVSLAHHLDTELLPFGREHFGFADGLAQPTIAGERVGPTTRPGQGVPRPEGGWRDLAPGEFVLGYSDEDGVEPAAPSPPFHRNASFVVVRKLEQDVAAFTQYLRRLADGDADKEAQLAAQIVGRWHNGTPLVSSPDSPGDPPNTDALNDFRFGDDPDGIRCPLGAHIRRANPRDAFGEDDRRTRRHRIIRRGMPYGKPPDDPAVPDDERRGLLFVCYQASIERQFETIQRGWLNDGDALGLGEEKDFLLSGDEPGGTMTIQGSPPKFLPRAAPFVMLKGGGYFFAPSISAVNALGYGDVP